MVLDGYYGDSAITVPVGNGHNETLKKLLKVTEESLYKGIETAKVGNTVGDVGAAVQEYVEAAGFSVVREFVGHGIGTSFMKTRRFRTSVRADMERGCAKAWSWR